MRRSSFRDESEGVCLRGGGGGEGWSLGVDMMGESLQK